MGRTISVLRQQEGNESIRAQFNASFKTPPHRRFGYAKLAEFAHPCYDFIIP